MKELTFNSDQKQELLNPISKQFSNLSLTVTGPTLAQVNSISIN